MLFWNPETKPRTNQAAAQNKFSWRAICRIGAYSSSWATTNRLARRILRMESSLPAFRTRRARANFRSEQIQLARDLPYRGVFFVMGYDKSVGAENPENGIVFACLQDEESAGKFFPLGLGHILASDEHITNKGLGGIKNADFLAV